MNSWTLQTRNSAFGNVCSDTFIFPKERQRTAPRGPHRRKYYCKSLQVADNVRVSSERPRLEDVARRAGVSIATVSRALSRPDMVNAKTRGLTSQSLLRLGWNIYR